MPDPPVSAAARAHRTLSESRQCLCAPRGHQSDLCIMPSHKGTKSKNLNCMSESKDCKSGLPLMPAAALRLSLQRETLLPHGGFDLYTM
eukprot:5316968-Prymnesium_polylepis.1